MQVVFGNISSISVTLVPFNLVCLVDNCGGQNKNKTMAATFHHIVRSLKVDVITHYFLEKGHTQNEGDSVHSVVECAQSKQTFTNRVNGISWLN